MTISIELQNQSQDDDIPALHDLQHWATVTIGHFRSIGSLTLRIVDEVEMLQLNRQFRQKDKPTNVLSFPYEPLANDDNTYIGDIAICAPIVAYEARSQAKPLQAHWAHLVVHGILHCLGYDHVTETLATEMENREIAILKQLGFANPYGVLPSHER